MTGKSDIIRPIRLLDVRALRDVFVKGSIFDAGYARQLERARFLDGLGARITMPVMPDDEAVDYLVTAGRAKGAEAIAADLARSRVQPQFPWEHPSRLRQAHALGGAFKDGDGDAGTNGVEPSAQHPISSTEKGSGREIVPGLFICEQAQIS